MRISKRHQFVQAAALTAMLFVLFLAGCQTAAPKRHTEARDQATALTALNLDVDYYALVCGNSTYTNGWRALKVRADAEAVAEALEKNDFKVELRLDLTAHAFERALVEFFFKYGTNPKNNLLVYYAGHGYTEKLATGEPYGSLVMVDAPLPESDRVEFRLRSVPMQRFIDLSKMVSARHILFMFDSCFSGSVFSGQSTPRTVSRVDQYEERLDRKVRQFITSGSADQAVPDFSYFRQSLTTLLRGDSKNNPLAKQIIADGYITGEELGNYLSREVGRYNPGQSPQYGKIRDPQLSLGDFVLKLPIELHPPPEGMPRKVIITSNVDGARVFIDSEKRGYIRSGRLELDLKPEKYNLRIVKVPSTYRPHVATLRVEPGWLPFEYSGILTFSPPNPP